MPVSLTQQQREQITAALFRGEDPRLIANAHNISERQVRRISQNLCQYGTVTAPRLKKMGRPACLNKGIEEDLRKFVAAQPLALLGDMQKHVQTTYNIKCSRASISRRMKEMGYTRAIIRRGPQSADKSIPELSAVDYARLMADPSPTEELMNLPGNAKRARYAWLTEPEPVAKPKKPRKKRTSNADGQAQRDGQELQQPVAQLDDPIPQLQAAIARSPDNRNNGLIESQYPDPAANGMAQSIPRISSNVFVPRYMPPYRPRGSAA